MANEVGLSYGITGKTLYFVLRNALSQPWYTVGSVFEAYNSAHYVAGYTTAMSEEGASGFYAGTMPAVPVGVYDIEVRDRAGGAPVESPATDAVVGTGEINWSGTAAQYLGTPQTGDSFARIGATGSGLTSLAPSSTALTTATWTSARAGYLDNINVGGAVASHADALTIDADVLTRMATFSLPTNFSSLGITVAGKISEVVLADTLTTYSGNTPQTGDSFLRLGAPVLASVSADVAAVKASVGSPLQTFTVDGLTCQAALQYIAASTAGKVSGAGSGTEVFKGIDGVTTRLTILCDTNGNRTSVTYG